MLSVLFLGLLMGMIHALEADHFAAVAAMSVDKSGGKNKMMVRGAFWGMGHTVTLFLVGGVVIIFGLSLTDADFARLEFAVGVMLVLLGVHLFYRLVRQRIHFHIHTHVDGKAHLHAHSHAGEAKNHSDLAHDHPHHHKAPWKALLVGLVHGAAGSAGLLTLAIATVESPAMAMGYIFIFGVGSILGMMILSYAVAWPLSLVERSAAFLHKAFCIGAGLVTIGIGFNVMASTLNPAWGG